MGNSMAAQSRGCAWRAGFSIAILALSTLLSVRPTSAQAVFGDDGHTVTVNVQPITVLSLTGSLVSMSITNAQAVAGEDLMTIVDENSRLQWGINANGRKITASTNLAAPLFQLRLVAVSPTAGSAGPEFALETAARDLLLNVGRSTGSCFLRYTGVALASQGTGADTHTITFTVTTQ